MRNSILAVSVLFLLTFTLLFTGCTKEEIISPDEVNLQSQVLSTQRTATLSCCSVSGTHQPWCDWRPEISSVLNCCHVETLPGNCQWAPAAPLETETIYMGVQLGLSCTASYVNDKILYLADWANDSRPLFNYLIVEWEVSNYGTYNGICTLEITVTYRKKFCSFQ